MAKKPDRLKFLEALDNEVDVFIDNSKNIYNNIIAISHNDADGISSLQIIQNLLYKLKKNFDYFIYNRSVSWAAYLNGILPKRQTEKTALIFTDIGSTLTELIPIILMVSISTAILGLLCAIAIMKHNSPKTDLSTFDSNPI